MNTPVPTALHTSQPSLDEWLAGLDPLARPALRALGTLLSGAAAAPKSETEDQFTARCLGVADCGQLVEEERDLSPVGRMTFPLALAEWIGGHPQCVVGPGEHTNSPMWTQTEIGDHQYRHPMCLRAYFPAGTLLEETGCVLHVESRAGVLRSAVVSAFVAPEHQDLARRVLDRLSARAGELNPFRGRVVRAVYDGGLRLVAMDLPSSVTRDSVVVSEGVWAEVDLGVVSVRDRFALLNAHGAGFSPGRVAVRAAGHREVGGVRRGGQGGRRRVHRDLCRPEGGLPAVDRGGRGGATPGWARAARSRRHRLVVPGSPHGRVGVVGAVAGHGY